EAEDHCLPDWCLKIKRSIPMKEVKSKLVEYLKKEGVSEKEM
ncbi:11651_t:CDS:1, partial [Paraglomus brasilianum]